MAQSTLVTDHLVNKLRSLDFTFRKQKPRTMQWRRGADGCRVLVPRKQRVDVATAAAVLRQAGCGQIEIDEFIQASQA